MSAPRFKSGKAWPLCWRLHSWCRCWCVRLQRRRVLLDSEQDADFEYAAGLCRVGSVGAKDQSRCRAARSDVRNLCSSKEDFVLISWSKGYRPCVAAGTIEEIGCPISQAAFRADIFEANRQAKARQRRIVAKAVFCQDRAADC